MASRVDRNELICPKIPQIMRCFASPSVHRFSAHSGMHQAKSWTFICFIVKQDVTFATDEKGIKYMNW